MYTVITLLSLINGPSDRTLPNGCPSDPQTRYLQPHETDCSKYYNCTNGIKTEMSCDPGTLFYGNLQICYLASSVDCKKSASTLITTTAQPSPPLMELMAGGCPADLSINYLLPHGQDCGKFYICHSGEKIEISCSPGRLYDYKLQACVIARFAKCYHQEETTSSTTKTTTVTTPSSTTSEGSIDFLPNGCPEDFSIDYLLPHKTDCSKYYNCRKGIKILMSCGAGISFDYDFRTCAHLAKCYPGATPPPAKMKLRARNRHRGNVRRAGAQYQRPNKYSN